MHGGASQDPPAPLQKPRVNQKSNPPFTTTGEARVPLYPLSSRMNPTSPPAFMFSSITMELWPVDAAINLILRMCTPPAVLLLARRSGCALPPNEASGV